MEMNFQSRDHGLSDLSSFGTNSADDTRSELVKTIERLEQEHEEAARQLGEIKATIAVNYGPDTDRSLIKVDVDSQSVVKSVIEVFRKYEAKQRELIETIEQMRKDVSCSVRSFESGQSWIDKTGRYVRLIGKIPGCGPESSWTAMVIGLCSAPDVVVYESELVTLL